MDQEDKMVVPPRKEPELEKKLKQEQKALNEKEMVNAAYKAFETLSRITHNHRT
ncbi:hypothetical protein YC2023_018145 [Brassica napus]